jgi:arylsulfatase A-like enzyme
MTTCKVMKKLATFLVAALAGLFGAVHAQGAVINWTNKVISGVADVSTNGVLIEALNFSGGAPGQAANRNTTINDVWFAGLVDGTGGNAWADPDSGIFSANSDSVIPFAADFYDTGAGGLAAFDTLMSQFIYDGDIPNSRILLQSLAVSRQYEIQLFIADTRASQSGSTVKIDGSYTSNVYAENAGLILTGTYTADAVTQGFHLNRFANGNDERGLQLNGYQLRMVNLPEIPDAPVGLVAVASDALVQLDWTDHFAPDIDSYRVKRSTTQGGPYVEIAAPAAHAFTDTTVTNLITYYYVVTAVDTDGDESVDSAEVEATPERPIDLAGDSDGDGSRDTLELMLGTDPFNSNSFFGVSCDYRFAPDNVLLAWPSALGASYSVKYSADIRGSNVWQDIAGPFAGTGAEMNYTDTKPARASGQRGYYVVIAHLPPPNIVMLMSDDHVANAMGNMNHPDHPEVITPSLDLLASRGVRFDRAYANTAICRPSRATFFSGLYEYKHVTNFNAPNALATSIWNESYPLLLKNAGYRIAFAGKWGFGMELTEAAYSAQFDTWGGFAGDGQGSYTTAGNPPGIAAYALEYPHVSRALGAFGRDFIRESVATQHSSPTNIPFCLTIGFKAPHRPHGNYDASMVNLYDHVSSFVEPMTWSNEFGVVQPKFGRGYTRSYSAPAYQDAAHAYYRLVSGMDAGVGMILDELEVQGVAHNTVVLYTSDNGYFLGSHGGQEGKTLTYEEGSRIPIIIYDPRAPLESIGATSQAVGGSIDHAPTALDYAGVDIPSNMDGLSLRPIVRDPSDRVRDAMLLIQNWTNDDDDLSRALSVVTDQYKYIFWPYGDSHVTPTEELFDLQADPFETNNVASSVAAGTLNQLRSYYDGFLQDWIDNVPAGVMDYERMGEIYDRLIPHTNKTFMPIPVGSTNYRDNYQDVTGFPYPF